MVGLVDTDDATTPDPYSRVVLRQGGQGGWERYLLIDAVLHREPKALLGERGCALADHLMREGTSDALEHEVELHELERSLELGVLHLLEVVLALGMRHVGVRANDQIGRAHV